MTGALPFADSPTPNASFKKERDLEALPTELDFFSELIHIDIGAALRW